MKQMMKIGEPIGILGGMGPDASARLYAQIIELSRTEFGARANDDYPEIVLQSIPVPDFITDTRRAEEAVFMLKDRVRRMAGLPLSCLALACNTAHTTLVDLATVTSVPFVSIPREVAKEIGKNGYKRVGLLATPTTVYSGVYQVELQEMGVELVLPEHGQIEQLGKIVGEIIGGDFKPPKKQLLTIADGLKKKKVEAIILGCTELPLVFPKNYSLPVLDSVEILARALLKRYYKEEAT